MQNVERAVSEGSGDGLRVDGVRFVKKIACKVSVDHDCFLAKRLHGENMNLLDVRNLNLGHFHVVGLQKVFFKGH